MIEDSAVVLMKVGYHAREEFHAIVERKRAELRSTGQTWWGYGGTVCNPQTQVQPFSRDNDGAVSFVFLPTSSRPQNLSAPAATWSVDKKKWSPIPAGITVTGSKYALVLGELEEVTQSIDLAHYTVAVGPKMGKPANQYLRFQCDKACLRRSEVADGSDVRPIVLRGRLANPWAVFLR